LGGLKLKTEDERSEVENMKTERKEFLELNVLTSQFKHLKGD